jgi:hypothetical protein
MKTHGHSTGKYSTVKILATRMGSYTLSPHLTVRSTLGASTSGPSGKLRVNPVVNDPNLTGNPTMVPVKCSKLKSNNQTNLCSSEKSSHYTVQRDA